MRATTRRRPTRWFAPYGRRHARRPARRRGARADGRPVKGRGPAPHRPRARSARRRARSRPGARRRRLDEDEAAGIERLLARKGCRRNSRRSSGGNSSPTDAALVYRPMPSARAPGSAEREGSGLVTSRGRQSFLDYSRATVIRGPSSSLVPADDPTLCSQRRMNQFRTVSWPQERRLSARGQRQKCMRVSGKHNDSRTSGHPWSSHVLRDASEPSRRELLQARAIPYAWELLTKVGTCRRTA